MMMTLPLWAQYLLEGIAIFATLSASAVVVGRTGRNPYLVFLLLVPFVQIVAIWALAFTKWPKKKNRH